MKTENYWEAIFDIRVGLRDDTKSLCGDFENFDFSAGIGHWKFEILAKIWTFDRPKKSKI